MRPYRQIRTITGQKMFVRETRAEHIDRIMLAWEIILTPIVMVFVFALAAGMI